MTAVEALEIIAIQESAVTDDLDHVEIYTLGGLVTLLWHGRGRSERTVVLVGGAMGGLLGPADGLFADLGQELLAHDISTVRVSYRRPNDLDACVHDVVAITELAVRGGTERVVLGGHSFGGAVAVRSGVALGDYVAGVVTFATQSAGCEIADQLPPTPLRLYHGDRDELLPLAASELVAALGEGELTVLADTGHLLAEAGDRLRGQVEPWIVDRLERGPAGETDGRIV
ncbi:MAG: alpha/beta hydrolase [Acidimicrobiia bacterium]|nr:alpha/beta hydrolase [Acidimicrobiia bacterium]